VPRARSVIRRSGARNSPPGHGATWQSQGMPEADLLVPIAEFGDRFECETAAAFARTGGHEIEIKREDVMSARYGANLNVGRFVLLARVSDAVIVRDALLAGGTNPAALAPPPAGLPWRAAAIATAVLVLMALVVVLAGAMQGRL